MNLKYIVLTCVNRDDIADGGAEHFASTVKAIKSKDSNIEVEVLTSDFNGSRNAIRTVVQSPIKVFAQNIETVKRLTHPIRDPRAGYAKTLKVLKAAKEINPNIITKTSLIVGLGETDAEIYQTFEDLRNHDVDIITLGQYLRPTLNHRPIDRWVKPKQFDQYREKGLKYGFLEVISGPMVRSSYRAERALDFNNAGL
jgi:Lipoate synthase